jgi:Ca-dependent carbohydrate-binding module xylan-binding
MNHLGLRNLPPAFLFLFLVLFTAGCKLQVEKLEPYGINDQDFVANPKIGRWQDTAFRFCCNGTIATHRSQLDKGDYVILLDSRGTPAYKVYPTIRLRVDDSLLKEIRLADEFTLYHILFSLKKKDSVNVSIDFDQDGLDDKGNDRDVLIRSIRVKPATPEDALWNQPVNNQQFGFTPGSGYWQGGDFLFCCNGKVSTPRSLLAPGHYEIQLNSKGTAAYNIYPLLKVRLNDSLLQEIRLTDEFDTYQIPFVLGKPDSVAVNVIFDQDGIDQKGNDRNVLIKSIYVLPSGK